MKHLIYTIAIALLLLAESGRTQVHRYVRIIKEYNVPRSNLPGPIKLFQNEIFEIVSLTPTPNNGILIRFADDTLRVPAVKARPYYDYYSLEDNSVANFDSIRLQLIQRVEKGGQSYFRVDVSPLKEDGKTIYLASLDKKEVTKFNKITQADVKPEDLGPSFRLIIPGAKTLFYRSDEIEEAKLKITQSTHQAYATPDGRRILIVKENQEAFLWLNEDDIQPIDDLEIEIADGSTLVIQNGRLVEVIPPKAFYEEGWFLGSCGLALLLVIGFLGFPFWQNRRFRRKLQTEVRLQHKIKRADTLEKLSQKYGIRPMDIMNANDGLLGRVGPKERLSEKIGRRHLIIQKVTEPESFPEKKEDAATKGWQRDDEPGGRPGDLSPLLREIAGRIKRIESRMDDSQEVGLKEKLEKLSQEKGALEQTNEELFNKNKQLADLVFPFKDGISLAKTHLDFINGLLKKEGKVEELQVKSVQMKSTEAKLITSFLGYYYRRKNEAQVERWLTILTNLIRDGVVTDRDLIRRLKPDIKVELQQKTFHQRIYEEVYKPYLSALMILLEELRNLGRFVGEQNVIAQEAATLENDISTIRNYAAKNFDIRINHVQLFTDYTKGPTNVSDKKPNPIYEEYRDRLGLNKKDILEIESVGFGEEKTAVILA